MESLRALGHELSAVDQRPFFRRGTLLNKLQAHLLVGPSVSAFGDAVCEAARREKPDVVFLEGFYIAPRFVRRLRALCPLVVGYTSDYFGFNSYFYRHLRRSASLYDAIVITNTLNNAYLEQWGARRILLTPFGYDPGQHFPVQVTPAQRARFECDVAFGGHREPFYEEMLRALKAAGLSLRVSGATWADAGFLAPEEKVGFVSPDEYRAMVCASKVAPAFLSKWNKNTSGGRTFEVAAMGALLIAERTDEQVGYFREGVEAEFFSSSVELVDKARRNVRDAIARSAMAAAGNRRCLESGYTYADRMRELLRQIEALPRR